MTRIGINPARGKMSDYRPARVSLCMLTYIPGLDGYFEERFEVLKLALASLQAHTDQPYDLVVFDNGSCQPVVDYLQGLCENGLIRYLLISSENIGKIGALRILFNAAPGQVIAYCDDDILFYPGWLKAHLEILEHFPKVGMVSGVAVRNAARHACHSVYALLEANIPGLRIWQERRIRDEWEADWAVSTGRDPNEHLQATHDWQDTLLEIEISDGNHLQTIAGANHFQFVAPKDVVVSALPREWSGRLMGWMVELDEAVDELGYLRLSTIERLTRHLGNALSADALQEARMLGLSGVLEDADRLSPKYVRRRHPLLRLPGSRRILMAIYHRLFDILYRK